MEANQTIASASVSQSKLDSEREKFDMKEIKSALEMVLTRMNHSIQGIREVLAKRTLEECAIGVAEDFLKITNQKRDETKTLFESVTFLTTAENFGSIYLKLSHQVEALARVNEESNGRNQDRSEREKEGFSLLIDAIKNEIENLSMQLSSLRIQFFEELHRMESTFEVDAKDIDWEKYIFLEEGAEEDAADQFQWMDQKRRLKRSISCPCLLLNQGFFVAAMEATQTTASTIVSQIKLDSERKKTEMKEVKGGFDMVMTRMDHSIQGIQHALAKATLKERDTLVAEDLLKDMNQKRDETKTLLESAHSHYAFLTTAENFGSIYLKWSHQVEALARVNEEFNGRNQDMSEREKEGFSLLIDAIKIEREDLCVQLTDLRIQFFGELQQLESTFEVDAKDIKWEKYISFEEGADEDDADCLQWMDQKQRLKRTKSCPCLFLNQVFRRFTPELDHIIHINLATHVQDFFLVVVEERDIENGVVTLENDG